MRSCSYSFIESLVWAPMQNKPRALYLACREAEKSTAHYKVGCAIECSCGTIVAGHSQNKTHPMQRKYTVDPVKICLHAEIHALSRLRGLIPISALIVRKNKLGLANSAPCNSCCAALMAFGVREFIFYSNAQWFSVKGVSVL